MKNILFVCTGNTCRSSMAEAIFNETVKDLKDKFQAKSAGTAASQWDPASHNAINALKELYNINLSNHKSSEVNKKLLEEADLVLTMTRGHKKILIDNYPQYEAKIFTLKEYVNNNNKDTLEQVYNYNLDIIDPYGMSIDVYIKTAKEIKKAIDKLILLSHE